MRKYTYENKFILRIRFFWEFVRFTVLNYYIFEAVLSSTFYSMYKVTQTTLLPMNIIFLVFLLFDFIFKIFITPYPVFNKLMDYKKIRKMLKYYLLTKKMILDLLVLLLFSASFIVPFEAARFLRLMITFRFFQILQFNKHIYQRIHTYYFIRKIYTIIKILYVMFLFSHYFGCWFQLMDQLLIQSQYYGTVSQGNQLYYQMNSACFTPIQALDDGGRYLYGIYFLISLITTIAFGDIIGKNPIEEVYVTILLIVSTVSIALILEQFMLMVRNDSLGLYEFITNYNSLKTNMDDNGIKKQLQNKVRSFLQYVEYQRKFHAHEPIVEKLPRKLRNDLAEEGYSHRIGPIFQVIGLTSIYSLCKICNQCTFQSQTQILDSDQLGKSIQFLYLRSGLLQEYLQLSSSKLLLPTHRKFFNLAKLIINCRNDPDENQIPLIYHYNKRKLRCIKLAKFIGITRQNFEEYINSNEILLKKIRQFREKINCNEANLSKLGEQCSICVYPNNLDHTCEFCPESHLVFSEKIKNAFKMNELSSFKKVQRKEVFKRNKTSSKKIVNKVHTSVLFQKFLNISQKQEKKSLQMIGHIKRIFRQLGEEDENKCQLDSAYDHSVGGQYGINYQQPIKHEIKKY